jgi:hypothetical protein
MHTIDDVIHQGRLEKNIAILRAETSSQLGTYGKCPLQAHRLHVTVLQQAYFEGRSVVLAPVRTLAFVAGSRAIDISMISSPHTNAGFKSS